MPVYVGSQKAKALHTNGKKIKEGWTWNGSAWKKVYSAVPPFRFRDDFSTDYADSLGPAWTFANGVKGRVVGGRVLLAAMGTSGKVASWYRPTGVVAPQDDVAVRFRLTGPLPYGYAADNDSLVALRCTDDASTGDGVWADFIGGKARIFTSIGGATAARSAEGVFPFDVDLEFRAVGRTFTIARLDTQATITSWTDSGNETRIGPAHRAFKIAVTGNFPMFQKQYNSPAFDSFEALLPESTSGQLKKT